MNFIFIIQGMLTGRLIFYDRYQMIFDRFHKPWLLIGRLTVIDGYQTIYPVSDWNKQHDPHVQA